MSGEVPDRPTTIDEQPVAGDETIVAAPTDEAATEEKADIDDETDSDDRRWSSVLRRIPHPAALLTLAGVVTFTIVFGRLGVIHHRNEIERDTSPAQLAHVTLQFPRPPHLGTTKRPATIKHHGSQSNEGNTSGLAA